VLFATACAILFATLLEKPGLVALRRLVLCAPLLVAGMVANNRRIVWVELIAALALSWALSPRTRFKKRVTTLLLVVSPLVSSYCLVGWRSGNPIFAPVQTIRSVVDSTQDRSSETRDIENYNLQVTLKRNVFLGLGLGHEYVEVVRADDISNVFQQYRYIPHNSVLGLWAFGGLFGFFLLFCGLTVGAFLASRSHRFAQSREDRAAALVCLCIIAIWIAQAWGDMGTISWHGALLLSGALAVASKLATATGAWRTA
jgi:hypothetical protein